ncbi:MAG: GtrA family protein [Parafilimonas sp.]
MKKLHAFIRKIVLAVVDAFYPLFKKFMPLQTFRYAACGGVNMLFDIALYSISYNYFIDKQIVYIGNIAISPYIFAFLVSFCLSFPVGFYLSRYVVWQQTQTKKRIQVFRYFLIVMACIALNYFFLKLFIEEFHWWPTFSKIITSVFVVLFSYFTQRNFSFKAAEIKPGDTIVEK